MNRYIGSAASIHDPRFTLSSCVTVIHMPADASLPLVVGAGPVGLTMANELVRHGVRCRIIERAAERAQTSRALAIFPRTLEAFETMGLAGRFLEAAIVSTGSPFIIARIGSRRSSLPLCRARILSFSRCRSPRRNGF